MSDLAPMSISRIIRDDEDNDLPARDSDFSRKSIEKHKQQGYQITRKILSR